VNAMVSLASVKSGYRVLSLCSPAICILTC
jgi:hypothetical protein